MLETRKRLVTDIQSRFDRSTERFLLILHDGTPDFDAIDRALGKPARRAMELMNLEKLKKVSPDKHAEQRKRVGFAF